jgi:hypothetical protein
MWKAILQKVKATFPVIAGCLISTLSIDQSYAQQNIIANKDNTRPETKRQFDPPPARVFTFAATRFNGYNEIQWNAAREQDTRRFIVEYSYDSYNFQTAGQVIAVNGVYDLKHYTSDNRPALYRIRIEDLNGKYYYSDNIFLNGRDILPVTIYPTVVTGNIVNANAFFPVERITIVSVDGQELFAKDMNGKDEFMKINIPSLSKGWYMITFYGNGWKSTSKFMVG